MKETKLCKNCKEEINKKAKKCPHCGSKQGLPGIIKFIIEVVVIIAVIMGMISSCAKGVSDSIDEIKDEYKDVKGKKEFNVGDTFENKHFKVTVTSVNTNWTGYSSYTGPSAGNKVVKVDITAENIGEDSSDISSLYFTCYADDVKVDEYIWVEDSTSFGGTISSGKKTTGSLYYEVPKTASSIKLEYEPSLLDDEYQVSFDLK